jgi:uncharacterized protein (DUF849 family)
MQSCRWILAPKGKALILSTVDPATEIGPVSQQAAQQFKADSTSVMSGAADELQQKVQLLKNSFTAAFGVGLVNVANRGLDLLVMRERGIIPELEIFDLGMVDYARYLIDEGLIEPPFYANILLGSLGTLAATPDNLCTVVRALPAGTTWAAAGIGRFQFFVNSLAVTMGGHVRVGLEDAIYFDWRTKRLATNAGLIDRIVRLARAAGREIATSDQTRHKLGFPMAEDAATNCETVPFVRVA